MHGDDDVKRAQRHFSRLSAPSVAVSRRRLDSRRRAVRLDTLFL